MLKKSRGFFFFWGIVATAFLSIVNAGESPVGNESENRLEFLPNGAVFDGKQTTDSTPTAVPDAPNLGQRFTLSAVVQTEKRQDVAVLFAKGPKTSGHYELWLRDGKIAFYSPDLNENIAIYGSSNVADGRRHFVAFVADENYWRFYVDGTLDSCGATRGTVADVAEPLSFGVLNDGVFPFVGRLSNVRIDGAALSSSEIRALAAKYETVAPEKTFAPKKRTSNYSPKKFQPTRPERGVDALQYPEALPFLDFSATTGYEGSISRRGDNADWDWELYRDENDEYVLFEVDGPGCVYNLTQHRYPTSVEPTFRFYLDGAKEPAFSLKQSEFGKKAPATSPLADIYEGPEAGGAGPIWVVRNFYPIEFVKGCKITSSVKLEGNAKARGQGGWGHVDYVLYDAANGSQTFDAKNPPNDERLRKIVENLTFDPKYTAENVKKTFENIPVSPEKPVVLFDEKGEGSVAAIRLTLQDGAAAPENFRALRLRFFWDGNVEPDVDAPIGTFFGGEYGLREADLALLMTGQETSPWRYFHGYNYFPAPFWESARIELYATGDQSILVSNVEIETTPASVVRYPKDACGYFSSSRYYEPTPNVPNRDSVIADVDGAGRVVYGVLSGRGIYAGCEGDVRVFFDGRRSPEMQSDGSESWASYGWGFPTPPQSNPFSGYNGEFGTNNDWSEVRLTLGDSYFFKNSLRFELEHGSQNDGGGVTSGQIFCYRKRDAKTIETDSLDVGNAESERSRQYVVDGTSRVVSLESRYANGLPGPDSEPIVETGRADFTGKIHFTVAVDPENDGVLLRRRSDQTKGRQRARVFVDGRRVEERDWLRVNYNADCRLADDSFQIPAKYSQGKSRLEITLEPIHQGGETTWSELQYDVFSIRR